LDVEYSFLELIDRNDILKLKLGEVNFIERNVEFLGSKLRISFKVLENQNCNLDFTLNY